MENKYTENKYTERYSRSRSNSKEAKVVVQIDSKSVEIVEIVDDDDNEEEETTTRKTRKQTQQVQQVQKQKSFQYVQPVQQQLEDSQLGQSQIKKPQVEKQKVEKYQVEKYPIQPTPQFEKYQSQQQTPHEKRVYEKPTDKKTPTPSYKQIENTQKLEFEEEDDELSVKMEVVTNVVDVANVVKVAKVAVVKIEEGEEVKSNQERSKLEIKNFAETFGAVIETHLPELQFKNTVDFIRETRTFIVKRLKLIQRYAIASLEEKLNMRNELQDEISGWVVEVYFDQFDQKNYTYRVLLQNILQFINKNCIICIE